MFHGFTQVNTALSVPVFPLILCPEMDGFGHRAENADIGMHFHQIYLYLSDVVCFTVFG